MYELKDLQSKSLKELKKIGYELNVPPEGDRRLRRNWIDAIAGVNPPLLQLLEVSPAASVEQVQEPIIETVETSPGVELEPVPEAPLESKFGRIVYPRLVQEAIEPAAKTVTDVEVDRAQEPQEDSVRCWECGGDGKLSDGGDFWDCSTCEGSGLLSQSLLEQKPDEALQFFYGTTDAREAFERSKKKQNVIVLVAENFPGVDVTPVQESIKHAAEASSEASVEQAQEAIELEYGRITGYLCRPKSPLEQAAKTSPGVEVDPVEDQQFPECAECFDDGFVEDESGVIKLCQCGSEPKLSHQNAQRAIVPVAKHHLEEESDPNPILRGIPLSDKFVARYSPPQPENIIFKSEPDGQLSLLDFEVQSQDEPPDPDDFESLDAFREAIASWDKAHPSSSDHCSDHCSDQNEPPDPYEFDSMFAFWAAYDAWDEASDDDSEPLEISLDSFCEWAPCPLDWYEPEASEVSELSAVAKSSITSEFFIPTFDRWGDRQNGSDEPPDTGVYAKLPKPKPPNFPPQATWTPVSPIQGKSAQVNQTSRNYPETIPKLFSRVAAGSSTQPARSPPGGEASF